LWSLSVEEQFYFLWPSVLKKWHRHRIAILWAVILVAPFARAAFIYFHIADGAYGNLLTVGDNLATGCLLAMFSDRLPEIPWKAAALMTIALALIPLYDANTRLRTVVALFVLSPLLNFSIAGILIHVVRRPYRILNLAPVVWLGNISYSLYLWQQPFFDRAAPVSYGVLWALVLACGSYYAVERPMLRRRERRAASARYEAATIAA
jgi:peptidoglycan/LPS O-acetylase OafA/YrhL